MSRPKTFPVFTTYLSESPCGHQHATEARATNCALGRSRRAGFASVRIVAWEQNGSQTELGRVRAREEKVA